MTTILTFDPSRCRKLERPGIASNSASASAKILMFTGVWREPLYCDDGLPEPVRHAPMFDDFTPDKPSGRKRR